MDAREFYRRYGVPAIEMQFQWQNLPSTTVVDVVDLATPDAVGRLRTAWYAPQVDERSDFLGSEKCSLLVSDVAGDTSLVPAHVDRISHWVKQLEGGAPVSLIVPAYGLPGEEYLLLDGNHRVVAAAIARKTPVTLHVVRGPVSRTVLGDLWRWETS